MNTNKKLVLALCAILIVAAIFIISEKMSAIRPPEHRTKFFPTLEERQINAITVNDLGNVIRLEKRNGEWFVGDASATSGEIPADGTVQRGADWAAADDVETNGSSAPDNNGAAASDSAAGGFSPADAGLVQIALEKIVSLKKGEPVSVNPDKQAEFDVGDTTKSFVKIYAGKSEAVGVLRVGKNGPDWNSNYARLTGSDTVYLIPGGLRQSLFFGIDRWRKKEPAPVNGDSAPTANTGEE